MKPISLHVAEDEYRSFKLLAALRGRPVAELLREAMTAYLSREGNQGGSFLDIQAHESGRLLQDWTRGELFEEMLER